MNPSPEIIQLALNFESKLKEDIAKTEEQITRIKNTITKLRLSHVKQVRLMIGDFTPVIVCDAIFPIKEIKKMYMDRLEYSLITHTLKLEKLKTEYKKLTTNENHRNKRKVLRRAI